ncbi:MAG TPA: hypothetical protein VD837_19220 [Terriglobales bacterium]|nr:hypothetical protein [Terriglobales bacterium]
MRYLLTLVAMLALGNVTGLAQSYPGTVAQDQQPQVASPMQGSQAAGIQSGLVPAGAELQIRTNENIVADKAAVGREFAAEIASDVVGQNGQVLIPKGSPAVLTVANVSSGTAGLQSNEVALALQAVSVNGQRVDVQAGDQSASNDRGIGANKRTAVMTGGGALLGTLVGAMAGGGKGAAIGALIGAGGGAAAQVLTKGDQVKVPAESLLTFKLDQPLSLQ